MQRTREIFQEFLKLEEEFNLFEKEIAGVRFWERVRAPLILSIYRSVLIPDGPRIQRDSFWQRIKFLVTSVFSLHRNPLLSLRKDILIVCSPRRLLQDDGKWWDIYSDYIISELNSSYLAVEDPLGRKHRVPAKTQRLRYFDVLDSLLLVVEKLGLVHLRLNKVERNLLRIIQNEIENRCSVHVDVGAITRRILLYHKIRIRFYHFLAKVVKPRLVVLVTSYGKEDLIEACKSLEIPVVELQHGLISPYHPGYSFPGQNRVKKTFPDIFFSFGDYWIDSTELPINRSRILSVGFPYLDEEKKKHSGRMKKKQILFISQITIGKEMSKFAVALANSGLDYQVVYKLHPLECLGWRESYPELSASGVNVIDDSETQLYKLFAESEVQVGGYSTAVYEGLAFGLRTFLLDVPGIEHLEPLLDAGTVELVHAPEQLIKSLTDKSKRASFDSDKFFKPGSRARAASLIKRLVER